MSALQCTYWLLSSLGTSGSLLLHYKWVGLPYKINLLFFAFIYTFLPFLFVHLTIPVAASGSLLILLFPHSAQPELISIIWKGKQKLWRGLSHFGFCLFCKQREIVRGMNAINSALSS
jgi:hypothetical protein